MELRIRPDHLYAASVALSAAGSTLESAGLSFARSAQADVPAIGFKSVEAAGRGVIAAEHAVQALSTDIARLAQALATLAQHYPRVDTTAVRRR